MTELVNQPRLSDETLPAEVITKLRAKAEESLYFFAKGVLGFDWLDKNIHLPICKILEQYKTKRRVRIVLPRSWLKSTLVTIAYPIWRAVRDRNIRVLVVQNSHVNACKKLAVIRGKFETCDMFRTLFPDMLPDKKCTWTTDQLCIPRSVQNAESTFEAAGTRTAVVSRHYDLIIEDDTVAPDLDDLTEVNTLPSKDDVEQAIGWHRLASPLLVSMLESQIIIVGTRWFEKDLISWNKENEPSYEGYERAVKETDGVADEHGELTWPSKFPQSVLDELVAAVGPYLFSCLYMNKPIRSGDMIFQPEWFQFYADPPRDLVCYTTVDLASDPDTAKGDPDYNVVLTTGKDMNTGRIYVLEYFRKRCNPSEVIDVIFDHVRRFSPVKVGIESVAYQKSMIYWVRERMRADGKYFLIEALTHGKKSKNTRIQGLQPLVNSGMLMFKRHHTVLIAELTAFPLSTYDDVSDALSMQIPMWAMTLSKAEIERPDPADDERTLDNAIRHLESVNRYRDNYQHHAYQN